MILLLWTKSMVQREISKRKEENDMKFSREKLLKVETLVDESNKTIITSEVMWDVGAGEVRHDFIMKSHMPEDEFEDALDSGNPGNYILECYPAAGTLAKRRLVRLSVDEALCLVNDFTSNFHIPNRRRYYIEIWMENITLDTDHRYVVQTKWFDTKKEAVDWYKNSFDYIDPKYCSAHLMTAQYHQDQDYDIIDVKKLKTI